MTNIVVVCGSCGCNNNGRNPYCRRCGAPLCAYLPNLKNNSSQRCARCGKLITQCECWTGPIMNHFDVSFDCYTCECHFNHWKPRLLMTSKWEDVVYLLCQNLISVMKYINAVLHEKWKKMDEDNNIENGGI